MGGKSNPLMDSYHHHDGMMTVGSTTGMDSSSFSFAPPVVSGVGLNQLDPLISVTDHNQYQQMGNTGNVFNGLGDYGNAILDPISKRGSVENEWFLSPSENGNAIACSTSNNLNVEVPDPCFNSKTTCHAESFKVGNMFGMENASWEIENPKIGDWDLDGLIDNNSSFPSLISKLINKHFLSHSSPYSFVLLHSSILIIFFSSSMLVYIHLHNYQSRYYTPSLGSSNLKLELSIPRDFNKLSYLRWGLCTVPLVHEM
ncbi:hypothetical protein Bca52824_011565 [Brassica carinata]|uniref:Uncharacterized protein n=1 Tax=Brassica carinata TaxID=52824 RepID=A0A8X8B1F2_BRACI|nr:hypothetical protein Bca52824_011565 [Brassica carinata]